MSDINKHGKQRTLAPFKQNAAGELIEALVDAIDAQLKSLSARDRCVFKGASSNGRLARARPPLARVRVVEVKPRAKARKGGGK